MGNCDFDSIIDRRGTNSLKHDCAELRGVPEGLLPLWVADMDFRTADPVIAALKKTAEHGIFGYTVPGAAYYGAVRSWWGGRFGYDFDARSVVVTPGVVFSLAQAVRAFTEPGDAVLIQRPVYYPFTEVIECNRRRVVNSPLVLGDDGRYHVDFADFEKQLAQERPKLFILCSPHNPVGRVWSRVELERMGDLCLAHGCMVVSDEIHADFTYGGNQHTVFSTIKGEFRDNSIVCTSPSKTFNLAGFQVSNIVVENSALRRRYKKEIEASGYSQPNVMGVAACQAAYENGGPWLGELIEYIQGNIRLTEKHFPSVTAQDDPGRGAHGIRSIPIEGTYLQWLDFRGTGLSHSDADSLLINKAGVWLDSGTMFGVEGEGFQRVNIASPRKLLQEAYEKMSKSASSFE